MESCKNIHENSVLFFYGELNEQKSAELQAHIQTCPDCRAAFLSTQETLQQLPQKPLIQPDEATLNLLRHRLTAKIKKSPKGFQLPRGLFTFINPRPVFQFGFAALLLAFGFFIGKSTSVNSPNTAATLFDLLAARQEITVANASVSPFLLDIEQIHYDRRSGKIEIDYNTINDIRMHGRVTDRKVHALLRQALLEPEDFSVRLKAVKTVSALAESDPQLLDAAYLAVLGQLLNSETNLGLRLQVLKIFKSLPWSDEINSVLQHILLHDQEKALRIAAFRTITEHEKPTEKMRELLTAAQKDSSTFIKFRANKLLQELQNVESVPLRNED